MVLLDMEMPKSCRFCRLQEVCVPFQREVVTEVVSIDTLNERHKDCPIKAEIPDNARNGDVIKALFPYFICIQKDTFTFIYKNERRFEQKKYLTKISNKWWNAPYKAESEE